MLGDVTDLPGLSKLYDVCIVGSGPAGLTLAMELDRAGLKVALLEAGGAARSRRSQRSFRGTVKDERTHPPLHTYRVRALGGTGSIWGGRCIPLDPIDFDRRPWVPHSGWPIRFDDLQPYYRRALEIAEAGEFSFLPELSLPGHARELFPRLDGSVLSTTIERFSRPTNFWRRYQRDLARSRNVDIFLRSQVAAIRLKPDASTVDHLEVVRPGGGTVKVVARAYVLAAGGLEIPRLLLASNDVQKAGVGNSHDNVGRYYMGHLSATIGIAHLKRPGTIAYGYERDGQGIYVRRRLAMTQAAQRHHALLNTTFRTHIADPANPAHRDPVLSAMYFAKHLLPYEYGHRMRRSSTSLQDRLRHVANILRHPVRLATFTRGWMRDRILSSRKLPSLVLGPRDGSLALEFHVEQAPNPESRVLLSGERDAHGVPRLLVQWQTTELDVRSLERAYGLLAQQIEAAGLGRLEFSGDEIERALTSHSIVGGHHIGTARMSSEPREGVVDRDCRVHGVGNLFVASAAVFPTSGQANPTLTVLALTLRLGSHLRQLMEGGGLA